MFDKFGGVRREYEISGSLEILIVHGMGQGMQVPEEVISGYSVAVQNRIAQELDSSMGPPTVDAFTISENNVRLGTLTRSQYRTSAGVVAVTFYELSWVEAVRPVKKVLLELDERNGYREMSPLERERARLNSAGKAFVNTHLADVLIYSGGFGSTLREVAAQSICIITRQSPTKNARCDFNAPARGLSRVIIMTHSLGSALVFDTVTELLGRGPGHAAAAISLAGATTQVIMFANQLPLLELRSLRAPTKQDWLEQYPCPKQLLEESAVAGTPGGFGGFLGARRLRLGPAEAAGPDPEPLQVVAFNDPNDLLTYYLSSRFKGHCDGARFANIMVTNADWLWLFLFANPVAAHVGYEQNDRIIRMLLDGGGPAD